MRYAALVALALVVGLAVGQAVPDKPPVADRAPGVAARADEKLPATHADMIRHLDELRPELVKINQDIWTFAELGLEEHRSAARL